MAYYYSPFRKKYDESNKKAAPDANSCPFCGAQNIEEAVIRYPDGTPVENTYYRWMVNIFPKFEGHTMVVPKKHVTEIGAESKKAVAAREELVGFAARVLQKLYKQEGVEVFIQTGELSGATIKHLHWHVMPTSPDFPFWSYEKLGKFYTTDPDNEQVVMFPTKIKLAKGKLKTALSKTLAN